MDQMRQMMKKVAMIFAFVGLFVSVCIAKEPTNTFLPLLKMAPHRVTQDKVLVMLGKPQKVDLARKSTTWRYAQDSSVLQIRWRNGINHAEKIIFNCSNRNLSKYDPEICRKFKEGKLEVAQAVTELGTPRNMKAQKVTQVLHYHYKNSLLRLFFRDQLLVDYTLVERGG
jgi:hypothetical protein